MSIYNILIASFLLSLTACASKTPAQNEPLPEERDLPSAPNCAADGPGCKQFNPDLK